MKKKVLSVLLVSMMVVSMVSCSNSNDSKDDNNSSTNSSQSKPDDNKNDGDVSVDEPDVNISVDGLAEKLLKEVKFKDKMSKIEKEMALLQYNLSDKDVEEVVMYLSTGATAEEIAVFKVKDESKRKVQSAVEKRVADQKVAFKDYNPVELEKLKNPTMYAKDEYVVLCISDEDSKSEKIINEYMATK